MALAGLLDGVPQRGRPREQRVEDLGSRRDRAVGDPRKDVLEPMDVVLDGAEPEHPAVALQGVQRAEGQGHDLRFDAVALQAQEAMVEGLEVLAGVLEVDGEQLGRDLEVERHESRLP